MRGLSDPVWEELIEPGDVLYVPRGEAHDAVGEVKPSVTSDVWPSGAEWDRRTKLDRTTGAEQRGIPDGRHPGWR
jgi:quercetin dioxygenase-like cupin family protein